jgi:peptide-methionine (S)-S-oxide reductase
LARQRALSIAMIWMTRATGFTSTRWRISNERRTCRSGRRLLLGHARSDTPIRRRDFPRVGYTGGDVANATYRNHGTHAEAIEIIFDPSKISYRKLLEFFFQIHDPTTRNRQGNDVGLSYRSAIFYTSDDQKRVAKDTIADVEASGLWPGKVVTEVSPAGPFWEAEPEHQDYLERIPTGYTCHFIRPNWKLSVRKDAGAVKASAAE